MPLHNLWQWAAEFTASSEEKIQNLHQEHFAWDKPKTIRVFLGGSR